MCGNFGLILLGRRNKEKDGPVNAIAEGSTSGVVVVLKEEVGDVKSANRAASTTSAATMTGSDNVKNQSTDTKDVIFQLDNTTVKASATSTTYSVLRPSNKDLASVLDILRSQTAATEIRGGQAGGFSVIGNYIY